MNTKVPMSVSRRTVGEVRRQVRRDDARMVAEGWESSLAGGSNLCNCPDCDTRDCPNGAAEAALLRDVETVVRECEALAGHRLMQIAGPARRFINLLRPHIEGGAK